MWQAWVVAPRALIVDDNATFIEGARRLLELQGIEIEGAATNGAEALTQAERLRPDVVLVDVNLGAESGFDVVRALAETGGSVPPNMILISTHASVDFSELVATAPVLGFVSKPALSGDVIRDYLSGHTHGDGCRHEALLYATTEELVAGATPFLREGLAADEAVLVVLRDDRNAVLREALADDSRVEFGDALDWYRSPQHALEGYNRYLHERLNGGVKRVRVVAEVIWPAAPTPEWKRYEASISGAMAPLPVSFICAYDTRELPADIVAAAEQTHPLLRTGSGPRPSSRYMDAADFVRELA